MAAFAYDVVSYPTQSLPQAHPSHLYALSKVFGMDPTLPTRCRYLEIGCGNGAHLIGCALALPDSTFVGIDLSATAIEEGKQMLAEIGLSNVSLYAADLTTWEPPENGFDYVVAHGLYSWVPAEVRDGLLKLVARAMSADSAIGYVSYNTYPGCYIRRMMREMLQYHTDTIQEPNEKIKQAREMLKFLQAGLPRVYLNSTKEQPNYREPDKREPTTVMFAGELDELLNNHDPRVLYHDDLAEVNEPVYFHQFIAHASTHRLRFVAEAEHSSMAPMAFQPEVMQMLISLADQDVTMKEQYMDFLRVRRFRQTLLSKDGRKPQAEPDPRVIIRLALSGKPVLQDKPLDLTPGVMVTFTGARGAAARTDQPLAKAALARLGQICPRRVPFADLIAQAAAMLGRETTPQENGALAHMMTLVWMSGMIDAHGHIPRYTPAPSHRPVASPLARIQARTSPTVTTLLHTSIHLEDETGQRLVMLLDGSRTREDLVIELLAQIPLDRRPTREALEAKITKTLEHLADAGLLVG